MGTLGKTQILPPALIPSSKLPQTAKSNPLLSLRIVTINSDRYTMTPSRNQGTVSYLEKLPLELHEPILSQLTLRDIIALAKYAPKESRVQAVIEISPAWGKVWPTYLAHKQDLQALVSLILPIGDRLYDPTNYALNLTPAQFASHMAHHNLVTTERGCSFFDMTVLQTSRNIQKQLRGVSKITLGYICNNISLETIALICPWLTGPRPPIDEKNTRDHFSEIMRTACNCTILTDRNPFVGVLDASLLRRHRRLSDNMCQFKHPGSVSADWTAAQIKAFVDGYAVFQTELNMTKAKQLRDLGELYKTHNTRLKTPGAPQSPRHNTLHIPQQLEILARHILRNIDIDVSVHPRSRQETSRFRYVHTCLVPYDWCLELWFNVVESYPRVFAASLFGEGNNEDYLEQAMSNMAAQENLTIPQDILKLFPVAHEALQHFFVLEEGERIPREVSREDKLRAAAARISRVAFVDPEDGVFFFSLHISVGNPQG